MTRSRRALVSAALAALILVHLVELARHAEHWPFCSYPMYSWLEKERAVVASRAYGIRADTGAEVLLQEPEFLYPFDQARLSDASFVIEGATDAALRWPRAVRDLFDRYERLRAEGRHAGPALKGLRVYTTRHELDPEAKNFEHPEYRKLLAETLEP